MDDKPTADDESNIRILSVILIILFSFALSAISTVGHSFVLFRLWEWFIVPLSPAVPNLTLSSIIGLYLFTRFIINYVLKDYEPGSISVKTGRELVDVLESMVVKAFSKQILIFLALLLYYLFKLYL